MSDVFDLGFNCIFFIFILSSNFVGVNLILVYWENIRDVRFVFFVYNILVYVL